MLIVEGLESERNLTSKRIRIFINKVHLVKFDKRSTLKTKIELYSFVEYENN